MNPYKAEYDKKKQEYDRLKDYMRKAQSWVMSAEMQAALLKKKDMVKKVESDWLAIKQKYESWSGDATVATWETGDLLSTKSTIYHTAPNGKSYDITWDGKQATFKNINGQISESYASPEAAKAYIDAQNPVWHPVEQQAQQTMSNVSDRLDTATEGIKDTMNEWIDGQNAMQWKIDDMWAKMQQHETDIVGMIENSFKAAQWHLTAANDLEKEAENLYWQAQIESQYQDLIKKGLNPVKAKQAALFVNLRGRAKVSIEVAKIEADFNKTMADLEMKKADLIIKAKTEWIDNEKRVIDQAKEVQTNIDRLKDNYNTKILPLKMKYQVDPILNIASKTLEQDVQNVVTSIQNQYDTSTNNGKIMALKKIFGDSFAYIDGTVYNYMNLPFDELVVKTIELIRKNSTSGWGITPTIITA